MKPTGTCPRCRRRLPLLPNSQVGGGAVTLVAHVCQDGEPARPMLVRAPSPAELFWCEPRSTPL